MNLRMVQFLVVVLTALAVVPAGAHLFELPNKINLPRDGIVRLVMDRGLWQDLRFEHDIQSLPRLSFSTSNHQPSGLAVSLLQPELT